jgi:hypothetical protein
LYDAESSVYWVKTLQEPWPHDEPQFPVWWFINPPVLLLPAAITYGIFNIPMHHGHKPGKVNTLGWWSTLLWVDGIIIGLAIAVTVVIGGGILLRGYIAGLTGSPSAKQKREQQRQAANARKKEQVVQQLQAMACNIGTADPRVAALPKEKQTLSLRFSELKGRVCKPFAG